MCKDTPKKEGHKCCGGCRTKFNKEAPKSGDGVERPAIHPQKPTGDVPPRRTCGTKVPPKNG